MARTMTGGESSTARFVAHQLQEDERHIKRSYALGLPEIFNELSDVAEECRHPGWDGNVAQPIESDVLCMAYRVLESMPLGVAPTSVGAEPDGHVTLEWHRNPRRTLSVSISPEGDLHYAALLGPRRRFGTEPFMGDFPTGLLDLISEVNVQ